MTLASPYTAFASDTMVDHDWPSILRAHFGAAIFQDWFAQLTTVGVDQDGVFELTTSSPFVKNWIENHYLELMTLALQRDLPGCRKVVLTLVQSSVAVDASASDKPGPLIVTVEDDHDIPSAPLDPRLTFDQFVVGRPNEFAYAAARRVAESAETLYNPLFLYGPVGHGKTHLMHSIAHTILQNSHGQKKILYLSAEKFMYYFIRALRYKNVMAFKERFRSVHVLMIDDVQFISGKESTQEEFFHTFNALVDAQRQVVISADKSPSDIEGLPERMKSRLGWGLSVDLHPTNFELRMGILQSKVARQSLMVPSDILEFLAEHVVKSVRELEGALNRVIAHSTLIGRPLSLELAQHVLKDLLRPVHKAIALEDIERKVCEHYHVRVTDLHSAKRLRTIVRPRQIAMFLSKHLTATSLPNIGRHFGGRDHTTVMHAISTIDQLILTDTVLREDMALLRKSLENR